MKSHGPLQRVLSVLCESGMDEGDICDALWLWSRTTQPPEPLPEAADKSRGPLAPPPPSHPVLDEDYWDGEELEDEEEEGMEETSPGRPLGLRAGAAEDIAPFPPPEEQDPDPDSPYSPGGRIPVFPSRSHSDEGRAAREVSIPEASAYSRELEMIHTLRPLRTRRRDTHSLELDEEATATAISETGIWAPVLRPKYTRWLDLVLIVEQSPSMRVWQDTALKLALVLERGCAPRSITVCSIESDATGSLRLTSSAGRDLALGIPARSQASSLVLCFSDALSYGWLHGTLPAQLWRWMRASTVVLLQPLPPLLWKRTSLRKQRPVALERTHPARRQPLMVSSLDPLHLGNLAAVLAGRALRPVAALPGPPEIFREDPPPVVSATPFSPADLSPEQVEGIRRQFVETASPPARALASCLASVPEGWLQLPIMHLVQRQLVTDALPWALAEIFMSGLLYRVQTESPTREITYDLLPGLREHFREKGGLQRQIQTRLLISQYLEQRWGRTGTFQALVPDAAARPETPGIGTADQPFAEVPGDRVGTPAPAEEEITPPTPVWADPILPSPESAAQLELPEVPPLPKIIDIPAPEQPKAKLQLAEIWRKRQEQKEERALFAKPASLTARYKGYTVPPLDLLQLPEVKTRTSVDAEALREMQNIIIKTLSTFGIIVTPGDITKGPSITRYEVYPSDEVRVSRITSLEPDIARATRAERINILAPIPGKDTVGIELPNRDKVVVPIRELLEDDSFQKGKAKLPFALGKDIYGKAIIVDLATMPHLLVAGATGSGKSVCINSIITSLLCRFAPDELRFIMIDPKVVEMQGYKDLPHLALPVVTDPKHALLALRWVVNEMEKRYQIFAQEGCRNFESFNRRIPSADDAPNIPDSMPYIVVIVDELADLMQTAPADIEASIARIAQKARAAGIHLILATQTPRADVITGIIKANIPCRIAFQVASALDSRVILDRRGADRLVGKGDMLYLPPGTTQVVRVQGAMVTDDELHELVDHACQQGKPIFEATLADSFGGMEGEDWEAITPEDEELLHKVIELIKTEKKVSTSLFQRRLRLGYTRAARMMDILEDRGIIGPGEGAKPREILVDLDNWPGLLSPAPPPRPTPPIRPSIFSLLEDEEDDILGDPETTQTPSEDLEFTSSSTTISEGRFKGTNKTIVEGEDLDVPTWMRQRSRQEKPPADADKPPLSPNIIRPVSPDAPEAEGSPSRFRHTEKNVVEGQDLDVPTWLRQRSRKEKSSPGAPPRTRPRRPATADQDQTEDPEVIPPAPAAERPLRRISADTFLWEDEQNEFVLPLWVSTREGETIMLHGSRRESKNVKRSRSTSEATPEPHSTAPPHPSQPPQPGPFRRWMQGLGLLRADPPPPPPPQARRPSPPPTSSRNPASSVVRNRRVRSRRAPQDIHMGPRTRAHAVSPPAPKKKSGWFRRFLERTGLVRPRDDDDE